MRFEVGRNNMPSERKDRTWWIAAAIFFIGFHFVLVCAARELGEFRASMRDYFVLPSERADRAIEMLDNQKMFGAYCLSTVILLAATPFLIQRVRWKAWIGLVVSVVLYLPGCWYGGEILHLSGKVIDWTQTVQDSQVEPSR